RTLSLLLLFKISSFNQKSIKERFRLTKSLRFRVIEGGIISVFLIFIAMVLATLGSGLGRLPHSESEIYVNDVIKWSFLGISLLILLLLSIAWTIMCRQIILSFKAKTKTFRNGTLKKPPAYLLQKIALLLPEKYRRDIEQNISDMRVEYYEALSEEKIWQARFIITFYYFGLSWSVVIWISNKIKQAVGIIPKKD
ncbi:MAG TPA: hypothetical protein VEQ34_10125, partial [Pyrinomonadaceae bacterium]|nr:hypothetical protein [Pyrinomonadaceae bacterium]